MFGLFVGGGATAAVGKNSMLSIKRKQIIGIEETYDPFHSFHRLVAFPKAAKELRWVLL